MPKFHLNKNHTVLVDDDMVKSLRKCKWTYTREFAVGQPERPKSSKMWYMHRWIMKATATQRVYHINHNHEDNRRENLQVSDYIHPPSKYRGVNYLHRVSAKPYNVRLWRAGKRYQLGSYKTAEEAARMYDFYAKEILGRNARLNFPGDKSE